MRDIDKLPQHPRVTAYRDQLYGQSKISLALPSGRRCPLGTLERGLYRESSTLETRMATGTVKWFNPTKGYGFIQPTGGGGKDVFVHISAVEQAGLSTLNEGQSIEYEIENSRGKESAVKLKVK
jgi:CspA family cold shock protein